MNPRSGVLVQGRGHISYIVKMHYFLKVFFFHSQAHNKGGGSLQKILTFITPRAGFFAWPYKLYSEIAVFV